MNRLPSNQSASSSISFVSGGASSGSTHSLAEPVLFFVCMHLPHRYDPASARPRRPDDHDAAPVQAAGAQKPALSVIAAPVLNGDRLACEHGAGVREVEPPLLE